MAVFKANFVKRDKNSKDRIKATIRYIEKRPGRNHEKITRSLFGIEGRMSRKEAYKLIDEAQKGSIFYRFVISPDPAKEDTNRDLHLREITEKTIFQLEKLLKQDIAWVAAEHTEHSPNRHVHICAILKQRLNSLDFKYLRLAATDAALFQRQQLDLALGIRKEHKLHYSVRKGRNHPRQVQGSGTPHVGIYTTFAGSTHSKDMLTRQYRTCLCFNCGFSQSKSLILKKQNCLRCGSEIKHNRGISLTKEATWGR